MSVSLSDPGEGRFRPGPVFAQPATTGSGRRALATELLLALLVNALILAALFLRFAPSPPQRPVEPPAISVELVPPPAKPKPPEPQKKPEPLPQLQPQPERSQPSLHRESGGDDLNRAPGKPPEAEAMEAPEPQPEIRNAPPAPKSEMALPAWARELEKGLDLPKPASRTASAKALRPKYVVQSNRDGEGGGDPYLNAMRDQVASHIVYPREAAGQGGVAVYQFMVARDGSLVSLSLVRSSGIRALDFAVENAIRASVPFRPLPPNYEDPAPITATIPVRP